MSNMLSAMKMLQTAMYRVNEEWQCLESTKEQSFLNSGNSYPFHKDFNELTLNVNYWVEEFEEAIALTPQETITAYAMCLVDSDPKWEEGYFYKVIFTEGSFYVEIEDELGGRTSFTVTTKEFKKYFVIIPEDLYVKYMTANEDGIDCDAYKDKVRKLFV